MKKLNKLFVVLFVIIALTALFSIKAEAATVNNITFDAEYYLSTNKDLSNVFGNDYAAATNHFLTSGINEGRQGSPYFDAKFYLAANSDLQTAFGALNYGAAYDHFMTSGINEGRQGSQYFDVKFYLNNNQDLKSAFGSNYEVAYNHYISNGISEARQGNPFFDVKYYLSTNQDLMNAFGANNYKTAFNHYATNGVKEARQGSPFFNVKYYLEHNQDIKSAFGAKNYVDAYKHYMSNGIKEARQGSQYFDVKYYSNTNPDIQRVFGKDYKEITNHYFISGIVEGRNPSENVNVKCYLNSNADLQSAFGKNYKEAINHYFTNGIKENRKLHTYTTQVITEATCTTTGKKIHSCNLCNESNEEVIPAKGHSFGAWREVTSSDTSVPSGMNQIRECSNCNNKEYKYVGSTTPPVDPVDPVDPTPTENYAVTAIKVNGTNQTIEEFFANNTLRINKELEITSLEFYHGNDKIDSSKIQANKITYTKSGALAEATNFYNGTTALTWDAQGNHTGANTTVTSFKAVGGTTAGVATIHIIIDNQEYNEANYDKTITLNVAGAAQINGLLVNGTIYRNTSVNGPSIVLHSAETTGVVERDGKYFTPIDISFADEDTTNKESSKSITFGDVISDGSTSFENGAYVFENGKIAIAEQDTDNVGFVAEFIGLLKNEDGSYSFAGDETDKEIDAVGIAIDTTDTDSVDSIKQGLYVLYDTPAGTRISIPVTVDVQ